LRALGSDNPLAAGPSQSKSKAPAYYSRFKTTFERPASPPNAAALVIFAKKPGGGLRFCVDYQALNAITQKDQYLLLLIRETLQQISEAKWFTKVDVIQAFHKICKEMSGRQPSAPGLAYINDW
jgi:hypothetical protein